MIEYSFSKKTVLDEGICIIDVAPPFEMLYDLSSGFLQKPNGVQEVIESIRDVLSGRKETYSFGGSDYCIIDCYKEKSKVFYDFGENEIEIETNDLLKLLEDWYNFLTENKQDL